jgi:hypothetical protein
MARVHVDVCVVNEQGELICPDLQVSTTPEYSALKPVIKANVRGISPQRLNLIMGLIEEVMQSPLDDDCIKTRSSDTVQSVNVILQKKPPVMLLFRYVALPGNILAAYYVLQNKFAAARAALDDWSKLKPAC